MATWSDCIRRCCVLISLFVYTGHCLSLGHRLPRKSDFKLAGMRLLVQGQTVKGGEVHLTDLVTMEISLHYHVRDSRDIFVEECLANDKVLLQQGCSVDTALLPNFRYDKRGRVLTKFSAFREVKALKDATVDFVCRVYVCPSQCPRPQCTVDHKQNANNIMSQLTAIASSGKEPRLTSRVVGSTMVVVDPPDLPSGLTRTSIELIVVSVILFVIIGASLIIIAVSKARSARRRRRESNTSFVADSHSVTGSL